MTTPASFRSTEVQAFVYFLRAHAAVTRRLDRELVTEHGLTINDYEVLLHLSRAPDRMMRRVDLAKQVVLTPSGITRLLDGLQESGFVCKAACASDARVVYAKLTDAGAERLAAASVTHVESIRALFGQLFAEDELAALVALLERLPGARGSDVEGHTVSDC